MNQSTNEALSPQSVMSSVKSVSRRNWILGGVGAVVAAGSAKALHAWDVKTKTEHDLTVVGQGKPAVVQIHNTTCPVCRRLKSALSAALGDRTDVQYRIADMGKPAGRAMAEKYNTPQTTLLFFDAEGQQRHSHTGLLDADEITAMTDSFLEDIK